MEDWRKRPRRGRCWGEACINGEAEAGGRAGGEGNESEMGKRARPDLEGAKARTGGPAWQTDKTKVGAISVRQPKALLTASYYYFKKICTVSVTSNFQTHI